MVIKTSHAIRAGARSRVRILKKVKLEPDFEGRCYFPWISLEYLENSAKPGHLGESSLVFVLIQLDWLGDLPSRVNSGESIQFANYALLCIGGDIPIGAESFVLRIAVPNPTDQHNSNQNRIS